MRGEAGVLYFVFSPQSCGVFPVFWASVLRSGTETLSGIRLGYGAGGAPPVLALRQQAGRVLFYRIIF